MIAEGRHLGPLRPDWHMFLHLRAAIYFMEHSVQRSRQSGIARALSSATLGQIRPTEKQSALIIGTRRERATAYSMVSEGP